MTGTEFKNELKSLSGVYLFYGSEAYLKRHYLEQVRKTVLTDEGLSEMCIRDSRYTSCSVFSSFSLLQT